MVAGLERPTGGEIVLDGELLANASRSKDPEHRGMGMVFQTYALWPHMNVFENVAYGLRRQRAPKTEIRERVAEALKVAGMSGFETRASTALSGGQQQRVAVARAFATRPKIILFDEPLSNLDAVLRESMRFEIRSLQQEHGITAIFVTHSQEEALAIADVVGVMLDGKLQQLGSPRELYDNPRNRFVAGFVGLANVIGASVWQVSGDEVIAELNNGSRCSVTANQQVRAAKAQQPGDPVSLAIRPENIRMRRTTKGTDADQPSGPSLRLDGQVEYAVFGGNLIDYFVNVEGLSDPVRVQSLRPSIAAAGDWVTLTAEAQDCVVLED
jgi:iron(III) transport system ATP-binding protein